jgi:Ca-activated chloride channel family protein
MEELITYKHPYLWVLGAVVLLFWTVDFWHLGKKHLLFSTGKTLRKNTFLLGIRWLSFIFGILGLAYLSYALMGPRLASSYTKNPMEVLDIYLVVDVSRSMLADDLKPNRLEVAKDKLRQFAALKPKDRLGIILFSEKIFTLLPLTIDPDLINKVIDSINIGFLGSGTNIGDALALAVARLQITETKNKIIILMTDGVSNVGNMTPLQAAEEAKKYGIKVYTIGIGSDGEARMPVGQGLFGTQYAVIPGGSIDFEGLKKISEMTNAKSYSASTDKALEQIFLEINELERTETAVSSGVVFEELYYNYLIFGAALYLLSELLRRFILKEVAV